MTTLQDYKKELIEKEEVDLVDLLEISSFDIVERFDDRVEEHWEEEFDCDHDDQEDDDED